MERKKVTAKTVTFKELFEEWYARKEAAPKEYSKSALKHYNSSFNKFSDYHDKPIAFFNSVEIQKILDSFRDYSKSYVVQLTTVLKGVLDLAYKKKLIVRNEFDLCDLYFKTSTTAMHKSFTKDEIKILWAHSENYIVKMILINIYTGFRPSELLEIQMQHIHLKEGYIQEGMKTRAGRDRCVPIHNKIKPLLLDLMNDSIYLFNSSDSHMSYSYYLRAFKSTLNCIGILDHKPHDARHTCSTLLAEANVPLLQRQKILGHSSKNITDDIYVHLDLNILIDAINKIEV